jgi:hypothetical protein
MMMMTADGTRPQLEDVLDEFVGLQTPPDAAMLREWTKEYPEYARELIAFATDWVAMEASRENRTVTADEIDVVVSRTMSRVQAALSAAERPASVTDLAAEIRGAGHDFDSFQRTVGIDRTMLDSLIARLVKPATLPALLVGLVAGAVQRTPDLLRAFFRLPPQLASAHRSRTRPVSHQIDFSDLVKHSHLPMAEQERWLKEAPDPALQE